MQKIASLLKNTNDNFNISARMLFTSRKSECLLPLQYIWGYIAERTGAYNRALKSPYGDTLYKVETHIFFFFTHIKSINLHFVMIGSK